MGRICPILNHPLNDGVLVDNMALVNFIQKRNVEFLPTELVCRSCKCEIIKLYNKKIKKAIELRKQSSLNEGSVSSLRKSRASTSSASSSTTNISRVLGESKQNGDLMPNSRANNESTSTNVKKNGIETGQRKRIANSSKLTLAPTVEIVAQNQDTQKKHTPEHIANKSNVTIRKRTIRDFLTSKLQQTAIPVQSSKTNTESDDNDVIRRLSQQPSTSKTATAQPLVKSNKRPVSAIVDDDDDEDDDECLSLNAFNGTRLPHVQPIPPKRKPQPTTWNPKTLDVMDKYIMDITGG